MLSTSESSGVARDRDAEPQHLHDRNFEVASETDDVTSTCPAKSLGSVSTTVPAQNSIPCTTAGLVNLNLSSQTCDVNDERSADSPKIKCGRISRRSFIHPSPPATYISEICRYPATLPSTCDPWHGVQLAPYLPGIRRKSFIFGEYSPSTIDISDEMRGNSRRLMITTFMIPLYSILTSHDIISIRRCLSIPIRPLRRSRPRSNVTTC